MTDYIKQTWKIFEDLNVKLMLASIYEYYIYFIVMLTGFQITHETNRLTSSSNRNLKHKYTIYHYLCMLQDMNYENTELVIDFVRKAGNKRENESES